MECQLPWYRRTNKSSTFKLRESACGMMKQQGICRRTLPLSAPQLPLEASLDQCQPAVRVVGGNDPTICVCVIPLVCRKL